MPIPTYDRKQRSATGSSVCSGAPYWVRLVRSGTTYTGYRSADGVSWTQVGSISLTMASSATQGWSVTAHNNSLLNTSTFDNIASPASSRFCADRSADSQTVIVGSSTSYTAHHSR